jgi:hypothetical protein
MRQQRLRSEASQFFDAAMTKFGESVTSIDGIWFYGTNLAKVNELTAGEMSLLDAAGQTWTAAQAARWGFTGVRLVEASGAPGAYSEVLVEFFRP